MSRQSCDFAIINARIWSADAPPAEALAAFNGRIVAVGNNRDIADIAAPDTRILDAAGRRVIPGLADAHVHFVPGGLRMNRLDLASATRASDLAPRIAAHAAHLAPAAWIEGGGWSSDQWSPPTDPHHRDIDAASNNRPAFLYRVDCHAALVNSAALALAQIDRNGPPDPAGGAIIRDPHGYPTGILRDKAMDLVFRLIPPPTAAARIQAIRAAAQFAFSLGLTSLHNMLDAPDIEPLRALHAAGCPLPRLYNIIHQRPDAAGIAICKSLQPGDDLLRCGACKNYMDGSLGSRTAWMLQPYADTPASRGLQLDSAAGRDQLLEELCAADHAGLQLCAHAIGDAANRELLDLYAEVIRRNGPRDRRPRVEHAQHLDSAEIPRFAALGAIASMQPLHKFEDGGYATRAIAESRAANSYRFRDLLDAGAQLTFGSDWPIVSLNPWLGVHAAVTARTRSGETWLTGQRLTLAEALRAYTLAPAYASFADHHLGRLTPGHLADLTILASDPFDADPESLTSIRPAATILASQIVWSDASSGLSAHSNQ